MPNFITSLFDKFQKFRIVFILFIIAIFGLSVFFASKIRFEEDISKMLPSDENIDKITLVSQNLNFADKLIINISLNDTNLVPQPDKLIEFGDKISLELEKLQPSLIKEI